MNSGVPALPGLIEPSKVNMLLANVSHPVDTLMAYLGSASTARTTATGHDNTIHSKHSKLTEQVARVGADCLDMHHSSALEALEPVLLWISANFSAMQLEHPQQLVRRLADFALLCGEAVSECHNTTDT